MKPVPSWFPMSAETWARRDEVESVAATSESPGKFRCTRPGLVALGPEAVRVGRP